MIEISITDIAQRELSRVIKDFEARSIRLIQQGFG
jgi:hypothetical protein